MNTWRRVKAYSRLTVLIVVVLAVLIFLVSNRQEVTIDFLWWKTPELPKFALIFVSANLGILVFVLTRRVRKLWHELQAVRRPRPNTADGRSGAVSNKDGSTRTREQGDVGCDR